MRSKRTSRPPKHRPTVVEARAFCEAFYYCLLKDLSRDAKIDVRGFYRASQDPKAVERFEGVKLSNDRKAEMAETVGHVQKALAAAYAARDAAPPKVRKEKPAPELPPGWRYAAEQEERPQRTNSTDYSVASPILARRGRKSLLYRPSVKVWTGVGCPRETWPAELVLYDPDARESSGKRDVPLHEGRLSAKVFENHVEAVRNHLDAPELEAAWLDRRKTLIIEDPR